MNLITGNIFKIYWKGIILILFVFDISYSAIAQDIPEKLHFKHLSIENGLSGNIINKIIEDNIGYIWIGTPNGLNRFDGSKVSVYYFNPLDSGSIPNNEISALAVDMSGNFWVGTKKGLCRFNYETESFERFLQSGTGERNYITSLYADKKDMLWVGTEHGLFRFNKHSKEFVKAFADDEINLNAPLSFAEQSNGTLLVGTWEKGFYHISESGNHKRETISLPGKIASPEINTIESILIEKNNTVWFSTKEGIVIVEGSADMRNSKYKYSLFQDNFSTDNRKLDNKVHSLCEDNKGRIWIGTENGLGIYDPMTRKITKIFNDSSDPYSISNNHIKIIFKDRNGSLWIGTYQGGVNIYHPNQEWFQNYFPVINDASDQKTRYVKSIFQDRQGFIWMGTDRGLLKFSENGIHMNTYMHNPSDKNSLNIGGVSAIYQDSKGHLWIGTWGGGIHEFNEKTGRFNRLPWIEGVHDDPKSQGDLSVRDIAEDSEGNLWFGSIRGFLDKYNPDTKIFEHFKININETDINAIILDLHVDKNDNLWLGTQSGGLVFFETKTKNMRRYGGISNSETPSDSTLNSPDVFSIYVADDEKLWLGTSNGIQILDTKTGRFSSYTSRDGLSSNIVYKILPDDFGNLWISTLNGITRFNLSGNVFINYDVRDGIRINSECGYKNSAGWVFFGGVNGVNAINPASISGNSVIPPIVFTSMKIFNETLSVGENSILKKSINLIDEIVIPYNQNVFSVEFAALNYTNSEKNQYKCKLEGFDQDWVMLGFSNEARYTNLSPGDYSLHVKASNNDGVWNETGRTLKIVILPPWWKTWWFRLLMLASGFLVIMFWILVRTFRLRDQQRKLKKLVLERTEEIEAQKLKLQHQADILLQTNQLLIEKQNEVLSQKEAIAVQNEKLELKNQLLEDQKSRISEQMQREQEMSEKLHELDQTKLRFFTNLSHEFRTPLTLILGPVEKLLKLNNSNAEFSGLGKIIQRNSLRLLNLINQFLDISKIESGVEKLNISKGDIFTYINGIVNMYHYAAGQKNIEYSYVSPVNSKICFFDADKIEKILYNLLSNAFKFTPPNGKISVTVDFLNAKNNQPGDQEQIRIRISDTGKGIPPEDIKKIFERFYQAGNNANNQVTGTGIGLALTHDLINIYRGTIKVESVPCKGSTFEVCLPVDKDSFRNEEIHSGLPVVDDFKHQLFAIEDHNYGKSFPDNELEPDLNSEIVTDDTQASLLIVDDNIEVRNYLSGELGNEYRIIEAANGKEGMEKALKYLPKLVICDVMMPEMNGYELCAFLKTDLQTCHIPVIILTAKVSPDDHLESIETGADAYIAKPFDIRILLTHIHQLISSREQLKKLFRRELTIGPSEIVVESSDEILLNRIIKVMSENISNPDFGVEELGREVGLSRTHLYRKLKQLTNHTAIEFVRNMRLQRAAQLFTQNKLYVAEVAYMSGFKELSYFRKIFREFYGMSPQDYINNCIKLSEK